MNSISLKHLKGRGERKRRKSSLPKLTHVYTRNGRGFYRFAMLLDLVFDFQSQFRGHIRTHGGKSNTLV